MATATETVALSPYHHVPETKFDLDWADLATLDLSAFNEPGGKARLAKQLHDAIQNVGFFYITNFGLTQHQIDRQFAFGKSFFDSSFDEKIKHRADLEHGNNFGYTPLGIREISPGAFNNWEVLNLPKFTPAYEKDRPQPEVIAAHRAEVEHFARHIHDQIVKKLLILCAFMLELPEDHFLRSHRYEERSNCHLRYMKYHAASSAESSELKETWFKGHTDFGSLTLVFRQPVAGLQVLSRGGSWKWVKSMPGSITVNIGDTLELVTKGFLPSSVHRVVSPPADQRDVDRLCLMYFVRPEDEMELKSVESPIIEKSGLQAQPGLDAGFTAAEWVKARVLSGRGKVQSEQKQEEVLPGMQIKYYT
ncbi:hypothetical protein PRZ48_000211 [Zasmidium cellare]|uniref:Fe2OG dioxygenase domain-containing protein n=1 Tax=Zasmidium cellare TaxID=395010 RepID=A0ABR0EXU5_ZASCE|nr:hypothetical protein PRZ48_000211 [Zasmidium cellare]